MGNPQPIEQPIEPIPVEFMRLDLQPGDILVLKLKRESTASVAARLIKQLDECLPGTKVLVLENDADLIVVRNDARPQTETNSQEAT